MGSNNHALGGNAARGLPAGRVIPACRTFNDPATVGETRSPRNFCSGYVGLHSLAEPIPRVLAVAPPIRPHPGHSLL